MENPPIGARFVIEFNGPNGWEILDWYKWADEAITDFKRLTKDSWKSDEVQYRLESLELSK